MLVSGLAGFVGSLIYGTFLEWFVHRWIMHSKVISKLAYRRHAEEHHSKHRSLKTFYTPAEANEKYNFMESSIIPLLWLGHVPAYLVIGHFTNVTVAVSAAIGGLLYLFLYEFIHFFIHVPRAYGWQKSKLWRWYCEYHRVHHLKARVNYNVVCPIADVILRTMSLESIHVEPIRPDFVLPDSGPLTVWQK